MKFDDLFKAEALGHPEPNIVPPEPKGSIQIYREGSMLFIETDIDCEMLPLADVVRVTVSGDILIKLTKAKHIGGDNYGTMINLLRKYYSEKQVYQY